MLNKNGESEHCYLVPDLKGKNPSLSLLNMMLAFVCVCVDAFYQVGDIPSYASLLSIFLL